MWYSRSLCIRVLLVLSRQDDDSPEELIATMDSGVADMLEYKDDGYIELVLKLLARICDGQNSKLQVKHSICTAITG